MNVTVAVTDGSPTSPAQGPSLVDILVPRVVYSTVGIIGVIGNALVLVVIGFVKELRSITNLLIANQSLIDLVASVMLLIFRIIQMPVHDDQPVQATLICIFFDSKILFWSTVVASTFSLVLITFERYYAVLYPLHYRKSVTSQRAVLVASVPWILGVVNHIYLIFSFKVEDDACKSPFNSQDYAIVGVFSFLIQYILPLVCIIYAYTRICISLRTRVEDVSLPSDSRKRPEGDVLRMKDASSCLPTEVTNTNPTTSNGATGDEGPSKSTVPNVIHGDSQKNREPIVRALPSYRDRARKNIINTLLIVSITFFICWTPNQIIFLIFNLGGPVKLEGALYYCSVTMAFCNLCVNPFIYTFKYRRFQKGFKKLFGGKWIGGFSCVLCRRVDVSDR